MPETTNDGRTSARTHKYTVFKTSEWREYGDAAHPIEDAFVLRSSDLFGPATLFEYANQIASALELDKKLGPFLTMDQRENLETTADEVVQLGLEWQRRGDQRVPD